MFDDDVPTPTLDELLAWLAEPVTEPLPFDDAHIHFLLLHPRMVFLKNLARDSVVFDIGAGEGQLRGFREWGGFTRMDLAFVGASLEHGEHTHDYEEFFAGDIEAAKPQFQRRPDAAIASQFIEHLKDPQDFLGWLHGAMAPGARVYFDWPAPHTLRLPRCNEVNAHGYNSFTINFHDDYTHTRTHSIAQMAAMLRDAGFRPRGGGLVHQPFLAESLKHHGLAQKNAYLLTVAIWMKTRFAAWIEAERV